MSRTNKIIGLILLLSALMGGAIYFAKKSQSVLSFEHHDPLGQGLSEKDFQEVYRIHEECFEGMRKKNLVRYFMKYDNADKVFAESKMKRVTERMKKDAEKNFATNENAFVVREGGKILGLFNCHEEQPVTHGSMMIYNVCVRKEKRGQGYGARFMEHALKECHRPGKETTLTVYKDDTKVVDFYKALNFKIISNLDEWDHDFNYFNKYLMQYQPDDSRESRQD